MKPQDGSLHSASGDQAPDSQGPTSYPDVVPTTAPQPQYRAPESGPGLVPGTLSGASTLSYLGPPAGLPVPTGPVGKLRGTGFAILISIVTVGIYQLVWYYQSHDEMKRHSGEGLGGGLALVLSIFAGFVMPYITASEIGNLYERRGEKKPVSGLTGLWFFPGILILIGPIIWFVKTNGALNNYWRSLGAH